jgi:hypothetical protein
MFPLCSCDKQALAMNWNLAAEKNREALRRILVSLLAMMGAASRSALLPRNIHRQILRLLRPAEAATRRLIIIAARDHMEESGPAAMPKAASIRSPRLQRLASGYAQALARTARRAFSFSLLDPLIRSKRDRGNPKPKPAASLNFLGLRIPLFGWTPVPASPRLPDDPLDAGSLARRLEAIGKALDDLPYQARRLARWQARRDAAGEMEKRWGVDSPARDGNATAYDSYPLTVPPPQQAQGLDTSTPLREGEDGLDKAWHPSAPPRRGGAVPREARRRGGTGTPSNGTARRGDARRGGLRQFRAPRHNWRCVASAGLIVSSAPAARPHVRLDTS